MVQSQQVRLKLGWILKRTKGSHEQWVNGSKKLTIATHDKELKPYLMAQIEKALED